MPLAVSGDTGMCVCSLLFASVNRCAGPAGSLIEYLERFNLCSVGCLGLRCLVSWGVVVHAMLAARRQGCLDSSHSMWQAETEVLRPSVTGMPCALPTHLQRQNRDLSPRPIISSSSQTVYTG